MLAAVDRSAVKPYVVGHSAASALAWVAADARPDWLAGVAFLGVFPVSDGETYAAFFPCVDGAMAFPGWEPFEGPDTADLDADARGRIAAGAVAVPESVVYGTVRLRDQGRFDVSATLVCPEFSPDDAREAIAGGDQPELAAARLPLVDLDSGHWPMFSRPGRLASVLAKAATGSAR